MHMSIYIIHMHVYSHIMCEYIPKHIHTFTYNMSIEVFTNFKS